jgi:hypothetical protein
MEIIYYADNGSMGDTSEDDCDRFREWAREQLEIEFSEHEITVSSDVSTLTIYTDDIDREDGIADFCSRLWDRCQIW